MAGEDPAIPLVDPCAEAQRLRAIRTEIVTGGGVVRIKENEREVQYGAADLARLDALIADYERQCLLISGRRRRFAKRLRFSSGRF